LEEDASHLSTIPVQRPFQLVGVDIMELPVTTQGNRYVLSSRHKIALVFAEPDQKALRNCC
jgi:hypothetical protein